EVERDGRLEYKTKFSEKKAHWPGRKQVFRFSRPAPAKAAGGDGREPEGPREEFHHDLIARVTEDYPEDTPQLEVVMREGRRVDARPTLAQIRARTLWNLARLPERYKEFHGGPRYPVANSAALERLLEEVRERYVIAPEISTAARVRADSAMSEAVVFRDVDTQVEFMDLAVALSVSVADSMTAKLPR